MSLSVNACEALYTRILSFVPDVKKLTVACYCCTQHYCDDTDKKWNARNISQIVFEYARISKIVWLNTRLGNCVGSSRKYSFFFFLTSVTAQGAHHNGDLPGGLGQVANSDVVPFVVQKGYDGIANHQRQQTVERCSLQLLSRVAEERLNLCVFALGAGHVQPLLAQLLVPVSLPSDASLVRDPGVCLWFCLRAVPRRHRGHFHQHFKVFLCLILNKNILYISDYPCLSVVLFILEWTTAAFKIYSRNNKEITNCNKEITKS